MRSCQRCGLPKIGPGADPETQVCRDCELERQAGEAPFPAGMGEAERAGAFIAESGWQLARTMLDIPHQYTVRDLRNPDARKTTARGHASFEWFVERIRRLGEPKPWGPYRNTYLIIGEWEYWTMGSPVEDTTIINRQAVGPASGKHMDRLISDARAAGG